MLQNRVDELIEILAQKQKNYDWVLEKLLVANYSKNLKYYAKGDFKPGQGMKSVLLPREFNKFNPFSMSGKENR